jgi:hypothetical protein
MLSPLMPRYAMQPDELEQLIVVPHPLLPSISLGMGQRFAVKGGYILATSAGSGGVPPSSDWVVP